MQWRKGTTEAPTSDHGEREADVPGRRTCVAGERAAKHASVETEERMELNAEDGGVAGSGGEDHRRGMPQ